MAKVVAVRAFNDKQLFYLNVDQVNTITPTGKGDSWIVWSSDGAQPLRVSTSDAELIPRAMGYVGAVTHP